VVLYFSEGADVSSYTLEQVQEIYRGISQKAFCFIVEVDGQPVGEGWLQEMNLARILDRYPGKDCRRIDLLIGERRLWGRGIGSEMIRLITAFGFLQEKADIIFGIEIADYNPRSLRAFQKSGYEVVETIAYPERGKSKHGYDVMLTRERFISLQPDQKGITP
jgi:RimJ/RimL family protein N-acetyltransferase